MNDFPWKGTRLRIHPLFWLVIAFSVWTGRFVEVLTWFVLVVIHELGHVTAAVSFGWRIGEVTLLPFGGVANTEEWGTVPSREELAVALAGPFHHVIMVAVSWIFYSGGLWSREWTEYFIQCNLWLAGFNLLPVWPLDGGRILLAILGWGMPYRLAISVVYGTGFLLSAVLLLIALLSGESVHLSLAVIALFLLGSNIGGYRKRSIQFMRFLLHRHAFGVPGSARPHELFLCGTDSLKKVVHAFYKERYHMIRVKDRSGKEIGLIPEEKVLDAYFLGGRPGDFHGRIPNGKKRTGTDGTNRRS
ncbi:site-2 protease family protein [Staphylospora marina]|uniref:site-2 protease family protein n=1 Tax=Staphylospora marina TaxID=2490858 RepID=UPI000F5BB0DC|nr:site-2 protease family protein [Staphylospora marina]